MTTIKRLAIMSSLVALGMTLMSIQSAHADSAEVYNNSVLPKARLAAKEAFDADLRGSKATCFIAKVARQAYIDAGLNPDTSDYLAVISRATYQSAKDQEIKDLLHNEVVLDCEAACIVPTGGRVPVGLVTGGAVLGIGAIVAAANRDDDSPVPDARAPSAE